MGYLLDLRLQTPFQKDDMLLLMFSCPELNALSSWNCLYYQLRSNNDHLIKFHSFIYPLFQRTCATPSYRLDQALSASFCSSGQNGVLRLLRAHVFLSPISLFGKLCSRWVRALGARDFSFTVIMGRYMVSNYLAGASGDRTSWFEVFSQGLAQVLLNLSQL